MEEQIMRFPLIANKIFMNLKNEDFAQCREVCRSWDGFFNNNSFLQIRIRESIIVWSKEKIFSTWSERHK